MTAAALLNTVRSHGMRVSSARRHVLDALLRADQPLTAEEIAGEADVASVYRNLDALEEAGIAEADVFIASTNGDNTNLVVAQIAQRRFEVGRVVARVLDPRRAAWYSEQGVQTICPTQIAIEQLQEAALGEG